MAETPSCHAAPTQPTGHAGRHGSTRHPAAQPCRPQDAHTSPSTNHRPTSPRHQHRPTRIPAPILPTLTLLLTLLFFTCPAAARTWIVHPGGSIQAAIDQAASGDTILILPGEYQEGLTIANKRLSLLGFGPGQTRILLTPRTANTAGLTISGPNAAGTMLLALGFEASSHASVATGVAVHTACDFTACSFDNFTLPLGTSTAIWVANNATATISATSFNTCQSAIGANGSLNIDLCSFDGCQLAISSTSPLATTTVRASRLTASGPIRTVGATVIKDCRFIGNEAPSAINVRARAPVAIRRCHFEDNQGLATISAAGEPLEVIDCELINNIGTRRSGLVLALGDTASSGPIVVRGCRLANNSGSLAVVGIRAPFAVVALSECQFVRNEGVLLFSSSAMASTITDCGFIENSGQELLYGAIDVDGCRFVRNAAEVMCRVNSIRRSEFLGNATTAMMDARQILNCSFVGNIGTISMAGHSPQAGLAAGCTIVSNRDLYVRGAGPGSALRNSIARDNVPALRIFGGVVHHSNIEHAGSDPTNISADPLFIRNPHPGPDNTWGTPDDDYGDLRLQPGSPCIDAADSTAFSSDITEDLAGNPRFTDDPNTPDTGVSDPTNQRPVADMGAYEYQPSSTPPTLICDVDNDGTVAIHDLLAYLNLWFHATPAADLNTDGAVDVFDLLTFLDCFTRH